MSAQLKPTLSDEILVALDKAHRPLFPDELVELVTLTRHSDRIRRVLEDLHAHGRILHGSEGYHRLGTSVKLAGQHTGCALVDQSGAVLKLAPGDAQRTKSSPRDEPYRPRFANSHAARILAFLQSRTEPHTHIEIGEALNIPPKTANQCLHIFVMRGIAEQVNRVRNPLSNHWVWRYRLVESMRQLQPKPHEAKPRGTGLWHRIRTLLNESPVPMTAAQMAEKLDEDIPRIHIACAELLKRGDIRKFDQVPGKYRRPQWRYKGA